MPRTTACKKATVREFHKWKVGGALYSYDRTRMNPGPYHNIRSSLWALRLDGWTMTRWTDGRPFSELRRENLNRAYHWINWDFSSATIVEMGFGDRPIYAIPGELKAFPVYVAYWTGGVSGTEPKMRFFMNGKKVAGLNKTSNIHAEHFRKEAYKKLSKLVCPWHPLFAKRSDLQVAWMRWEAYMLGQKGGGENG